MEIHAESVVAVQAQEEVTFTVPFPPLVGIEALEAESEELQAGGVNPAT